MSMGQNKKTCPKTEPDKVPVLKPRPRRSISNSNYQPTASFVAQVIATKTGAPTYRSKRRASSNEAELAYQENHARKLVRMPMGYLRALDA